MFDGFLPPKQPSRQKHLQTLLPISQNYSIVFFETKHRIIAALDDCIHVWGGDHEGAIIRELTKLHEQITIGPLKNLRQSVEENLLGEFTIIIKSFNQEETN